MKLVARRVLRVAVEHVAGDQAGLADAVEELVAALRPRRLGDDGNEGRDGEDECREDPGRHDEASHEPGVQIRDGAPPASVSISSLSRLTNAAGSSS